MRFIPYIVAFMVQLFVIVEVAGTRNPRLMPRWAWLLIAVFVPVISALLWFTAGRPKRRLDDDNSFLKRL